MLVMLDNYDSFTYNLVQYLGEIGEEIQVFRNDKVTVGEIDALHPDHVVISPGPGVPENAGISIRLIQHFSQKTPAVPLLGVCLGHQAMAVAFGAKIKRAERLMHGKTSMILHDGKAIFAKLPNPFEATRYHSLIVDRDTLPACLELTAETAEGEIMGMRHRELPIEGVQFHPESILTRTGMDLLRNFVCGREL
ncbi:MAG: anthranilate/aminodeoxychorismate synthase component II [Nitrospiraceae bacterium]|nr:anthranilate/aminodeoxychorismate synthase component II [Nitrospiraceae bacterium]|tara:strand:- start:934 stop:1515 length:582 start_codon:yes stop_codon:yes gene_type:complete